MTTLPSAPTDIQAELSASGLQVVRLEDGRLKVWVDGQLGIDSMIVTCNTKHASKDWQQGLFGASGVLQGIQTQSWLGGSWDWQANGMAPSADFSVRYDYLYVSGR